MSQTVENLPAMWETHLSSGSVVKNLPANAGDQGEAGSITGAGRSPGEGLATHPSILA